MAHANASSSTTASRLRRKTLVGIVTSNRMQKTIVVRVDRLVRHPLYHRVMRKASSFKAHDETNNAHVGDQVELMETRPLSKDKRWRLVRILRRASTAPRLPTAEEEQRQAVVPEESAA